MQRFFLNTVMSDLLIQSLLLPVTDMSRAETESCYLLNYLLTATNFDVLRLRSIVHMFAIIQLHV